MGKIQQAFQTLLTPNTVRNTGLLQNPSSISSSQNVQPLPESSTSRTALPSSTSFTNLLTKIKNPKGLELEDVRNILKQEMIKKGVPDQEASNYARRLIPDNKSAKEYALALSKVRSIVIDEKKSLPDARITLKQAEKHAEILIQDVNKAEKYVIAKVQDSQKDGEEKVENLEDARKYLEPRKEEHAALYEAVECLEKVVNSLKDKTDGIMQEEAAKEPEERRHSLASTVMPRASHNIQLEERRHSFASTVVPDTSNIIQIDPLP